jgi:hypothetical protein
LEYNETWSSPRINSRVSVLHNIYIYIYKLPSPRTNPVSEPLLLADDTSALYSSRNFKDFSSVSNLLLSHVITCFADNNLVPNFGEMNIMKIITKNSSYSTLHVDYKEKYMGIIN